jgi:succinoglycan biosynthesis protein ExoM
MQSHWQARGREFLMEHAARGDRRAAGIVRDLFLAQGLGDAPPKGGAATRAVIGVCTAMRPRMLNDCLDAIAAQIVPPGIEVHVVVVDNEPAPNNRRVVQAFGSRCPFPVHYIHEPRRGIPQARNAILRQGQDMGADWVAMTDDDCWVSPAWLTGLLEAAARHKADVVYGRREFLFPLSSPFWALPEQANHVGGKALPFAATHNVLMAGRLIRRNEREGLRFDERLAHGEDTDFFHRAVQHGARIVYAREPVVFETVSPERATLAYQTRRAYHYAASRSYFHRRYKGLWGATQKLAARWVFQAPLACLRLATAPLVWPISALVFRSLVVKGTARLAGAVGAAAGLLGFDGNPYRTLDGY